MPEFVLRGAPDGVPVPAGFFLPLGGFGFSILSFPDCPIKISLKEPSDASKSAAESSTGPVFPGVRLIESVRAQNGTMEKIEKSEKVYFLNVFNSLGGLHA